MMLGILLLIWYLCTYRVEQGRGQIPFDLLDASLVSVSGISLSDDSYEEVILPFHIAPEVLLDELYVE